MRRRKGIADNHAYMLQRPPDQSIVKVHPFYAVINDDAENDKLYRYMISMGFDQAYIGLVYDTRKDEWSYKVGDDSSYRDWGENSKGVKEPNNANGVEFNVEFDINMRKGYWNDAAYGGVTYTPEGNKYKDRYSYICEWDR